MHLAVNARVIAQEMGGQQRAAAEILKRLGRCEAIAPVRPLRGLKGHIWEQAVLPVRARGKMLWSPSATGPLAATQQVVTIHDMAFLDVPQFFSVGFSRFYGTLVPRLARRAAKVVTVSEFSRRRIAKHTGMDPSEIIVIGNGVSAPFRRYDEQSILAARAAFGLPQRYLLLQATADRRKNVARALEAWRVAQANTDDNVILAVTGDIGRTHVFGEMAPIANFARTRFLGFVDEGLIGPLIAGAESFLFPSIYEGFGLPVVEAMACGAPVLTSSTTATAEVAGDAALLIDPHDVRDIAAAIQALLSNDGLRERLREKGYARARTFSWSDAATRYRELFASLGAAV